MSGRYRSLRVVAPLVARTAGTGSHRAVDPAGPCEALRPILASSLNAFFGGYGPAATTLASVFVVGLIAPFFLPETKGKPLPA